MIYNQLPYSLPQYTALKATSQPTIIAYILFALRSYWGHGTATKRTGRTVNPR